MVKKKNPQGIFLIAIGLLVLLIVANTYDGGREAKPSYDGQRNDFTIELVDQATRAEADELFWVDVRVSNPIENAGGTMYVQCSILNRDEHDWLAGLQSVTYLDNDDNCIDDEPFTQIAEITLEPLKYTTVKFTMRVPDAVDGDNIIWCEAFEQCYAEDTDTMSSSSLMEPITIIRADSNDANDITKGDMCEFDSECKSLWFIGEQLCIEGYCVDPQDEVSDEEPLLPEIDAKEWIDDNKISLTFLGLIGILVGSMIINKKPKQIKYY